MKHAPLLTDDGYLILDPVAEPTIDHELGVPKLRGILRLENTSDTLRGVLSDFIRTGRLRENCCMIGRSGHSQIGLDIDFADGEAHIDTRRQRIEVPVVLASLNRSIPDILFAEIKNIAASERRFTVGRLFVPMGSHLTREEIRSALQQHHLLLPIDAEIDGEGVIDIPLDNIRYLLSTTLLTAGQNAQLVLLQSKEGLGLIQYPSHGGLIDHLNPGDFFVGAIRISLGPYCAIIDRNLNEPGVFHLAARLLDAVRTTGINVPRQVEIYNGGNLPVSTSDLKLRLRLFPADQATSRVVERVLSGSRREKLIREGVDISDATNIFNLEICEALFDNLSASPTERGYYGRILSRNKCIEVPRELPESEWHENAQNRILYEVVRGTITSGVHRGAQIPPDLREFVENLEMVGGPQTLRRVFVSHEFPSTDTLRVLKRNNVGVFVGRSIRLNDGAHNNIAGKHIHGFTNIYFGQTAYETFCDLSDHDGIYFYMIFGEKEEAHVREFIRGFWMTTEGKEKMECAHTVVAMFGSHVEGTEQILRKQIHDFLQRMNAIPEVEGKFAVSHGSGPGVMRIADETAASLGILRIGVGIDSEKIGQKANLSPPVLINFKNSARHMRQNVLDRTSLFKIYNIGGMGTFEEMLTAVTNLKLFESLPAPHIFVDPIGLGENGSHLWAATLSQLKTAASEMKIGGKTVRLAPAWVPNFCHKVDNYSTALEIITRFINDPVGYWEMTGIPDKDLLQACDNALRSRITIPPYLEKAIRVVRAR